jgi:hypothetical protein
MSEQTLFKIIEEIEMNKIRKKSTDSESGKPKWTREDEKLIF